MLRAAIMFSLLSLLMSSCATSQFTLQNAVEHVQQHKSSLPGDMIEGGVWVDGENLLVNRDFNMGLAMGMELVGPAIAAGQRITDNKAVAEQLKGKVGSKENALALGRILSECGAPCSKQGLTLVAYSLLYGSESARLLTVMEWGSSAWIVISEERKLKGEKSWTEGDTLKVAHIQAYERIVDLLKGKRESPPEAGTCPAGDHKMINPKENPKIFYVCDTKAEQ